MCLKGENEKSLWGTGLISKLWHKAINQSLQIAALRYTYMYIYIYVYFLYMYIDMYFFP